MEQLLCHLFGDYILQSSWMANNKSKRWTAAIVHACVYSLPFLIVIRPNFRAWIMIAGTHAIIDRFRLAKYVAYGNQFLAPPSAYRSWEDCHDTGYCKETPDWLAVWLMIFVDNTLHLTINLLAIKYL